MKSGSRHGLVLAAAFVSAISSNAHADARAEQAISPSIADYHTKISPILQDHCYECHGDGYDKGGVAFDALETDAQILDPALWLKVLNNTRAGLMPADDNPLLSPEEQATLEHWIKYSAFGIDPQRPDPGRVTLRRLNRVEYRNTIKDLLGVDYNTDYEFPADDTGFGFDNIGDALSTSPLLMEKYVAAAQTIVTQAVPLAAREPAKRTLSGAEFVGERTLPERGQRHLRPQEPADVRASFSNDRPGTYRVSFGVGVKVSRPDPARAKLTLRLDGNVVAEKEFTYYQDKELVFASTSEWQPSQHTLRIELEPLGPAIDSKTSVNVTIRDVVIEGPLEPAHWVATEGYDRYFPRAVPKERRKRRAYAKEILSTFAGKAYRRPIDDDTGDRLAALAEATYTQKGKSFEEGVALAMSAVLSSPRFLFRFETPAVGSSDTNMAEVDEYSLAARLSYFLWSTMPDEELMRLASRGELRKNLSPQVSRMLKDPRADNLASNFTGQWLQARDLEGIPVNRAQVLLRDVGEEDMPRRLRREGLSSEDIQEQVGRVLAGKPKFNAEMRKAMRLESQMYFAHVMREDRPVTELIDSNYTFVNEVLAQLYAIPAVTGDHMRKVTLAADSPRGGMLTQGNVLVVTSNPDRTSPVKRGLFVLSNFLGTPPPPPPANVPALEASETEFKDQEPTLRDVLKLHREQPQCASCHNRMDPIGLGFENFNALGMWRAVERNQPIVAHGELITGEVFKSVSDLKRVLANEHREEFYRTLTSKLMIYATGRGMEYYDVETIDRIVARLDSEDGRFSALLTGIIESAPFQKMRTQATITAAN
jgi:hypothetical protein